eukprot:3680173-Pyramimonas_sp.AAC.1
MGRVWRFRKAGLGESPRSSRWWPVGRVLVLLLGLLQPLLLRQLQSLLLLTSVGLLMGLFVRLFMRKLMRRLWANMAGRLVCLLLRASLRSGSVGSMGASPVWPRWPPG